jgi:hypothetical protein
MNRMIIDWEQWRKRVTRDAAEQEDADRNAAQTETESD